MTADSWIWVLRDVPHMHLYCVSRSLNRRFGGYLQGNSSSPVGFQELEVPSRGVQPVKVPRQDVGAGDEEELEEEEIDWLSPL